MIVDNFLVATQYRFWTLWPSLLFASIYISFNVGYYYLASDEDGDNVIYSILDWGETPIEATIYTVVITFVLIPLFQGLHHGVYRLRLCCFKKSGLGSDGEDIRRDLLDPQGVPVVTGVRGGQRGHLTNV
ncbi:unnamed protein product [Choristocarpus tenellus]